MAIEFRCSQCNQLLRVSDASAGKNARCPKCRKLATVPSATPAVLPPFPHAPPPPSAAPPAPPQPPTIPAPQADPNDPFAFLSGGPATAAPGPLGGPGSSLVSPAPGHTPARTKRSRGPIGNVHPPFDAIMSHAWRIWGRNLGLLVGANLLTMVVASAVWIPFNVLHYVLVDSGEVEAAIFAYLLGVVAWVVAQIYLSIGQTQISLKLARGNQAQISDLFGGGKLVLPVIGAGLLFGLAYGLAGVLCFVLSILLFLGYWPFYFLIVDGKSSALGSFTRASTITDQNWATAFVVLLVSTGIILLGFAALCIGTIVAVPLVSLLWATAYLMMSGQLEVQPAYGKP